MMKKITLLLLTLLTASLGFSQDPIDFETSTTGANWSWKVFEEDLAADPPYNVAVNVIANPFKTGINTSDNVIEVTGDATAEVWGSLGIESGHPTGDPVVSPADLTAFTVDNSNNFVTMMIYQVGFTAPVKLKLTGTSNASKGDIESLNSAIADQWTEIVFNMSGSNDLGQPVDQIIIFPSFAARATAHTIYIDNIVFGSGTCSDGFKNGDEEGIDCGGICGGVCDTPAPLVSAPLSTTPESDVLFLYSDVYTTPANQVDFNNANWLNTNSAFGSSTEEVIAGTSDNVRYITDLNVAFMGITQTDFTDYNYFHIDIWSDDATFLIVKWEGAGAANAADTPVVLTPNNWTSVDIDLNTTFSTLDRTTLFQMVFDAAGGKDFYFDNVYFSKTDFVLGTQDFSKTSFKAYPNPTQDSWTVRTENSNMSSIQVFDILGKNVLSLVPNASETIIDGSSLKSGLYFAQIKTATGINSIKLIKN